MLQFNFPSPPQEDHGFLQSSKCCHSYHRHYAFPPTEDNVTARSLTDSSGPVLDPTHISPPLPLPAQQTERDRFPQRQERDNTHSLAYCAYDGVTYIVTIAAYICFCAIPYILDHRVAPFGLFGFILGIVCEYCFAFFVIKNYQRQVWLRQNKPELQDECHGFWSYVARTAAYASPLSL